MQPADEPRSVLATPSEPPHGRRLSRLVAGYDGSGSADAAAEFALWLAGRTRCAATLVHAGPAIETTPSAERLPVAPERVVAYEREWRRRLEALRDAAPDDPLTDCRVVEGSPAGALIAAAADSGADMILTGSRGVGRVRGALLGSVSSQVLAHAPCSVMVFRELAAPVPATRARAIVVGVDGSASSHEALELAQALAAPLGATLVLVHAYDPHIPFAVMTTEGMHEVLRRHGHELVEAAGDAVTAPLRIVHEVVEGHARDALVAACERHAPALLVVGSRGLGGFKELLVGSTSRWVVEHAPCPVLVARGSGHAP